MKAVFRQSQGRLRNAGEVPQLDDSHFDLLRSPRVLLLDLREVFAFVSGFIPGSVHLPEFLSPELLAMAGFRSQRSVYLVTDSQDALASATKFFRRMDDMPVVGWFASAAVEEWRRANAGLGSIEYIAPETLAVRVAAWKTTVAELRSRDAFRNAHIPDSILIALHEMPEALAGLPPETSLSLVCESGGVSSFAASLLWNAGYRNLAIVAGGFEAYRQRRLPMMTATGFPSGQGATNPLPQRFPT